jgi:large subunit ribosomal protein L2
MVIVKYKPTSPGRRLSSVNRRSLSVADDKKLRSRKFKKSGRNNQGKITIRHRGGGAKQHYRIIDFKREKFNIPARVIALAYDPNRSAELAVLQYADGNKCYIIAPAGLQINDVIMSSETGLEIKIGNNMPLQFIPDGQAVHCVELYEHGGAKIGRSAGNSLVLMGKENSMVQLKMPSSEIRIVSEKCRATIGDVSNSEHANIRWGKAGRMRHRGIKPTVRGKAMNPVDHPHGGGEGNQPIGLKHPKTPWGKPALGVKTRKSKPSNQFIIKRRKSKNK